MVLLLRFLPYLGIHKLASLLSLISYPSGTVGAWEGLLDSISNGTFVSLYIST